MNRIRPFLAALLLLCAPGLMLAGCRKQEAPANLPAASHLADEATFEETGTILKNSDLSNADAVLQWISDFNETVGTDGKLTGDWTAPDQLAPDVFACMDAWEASHEYSDANCRITAFTLLYDQIKMSQAPQPYNGTYLMFDLDALENGERYALIREKQAIFESLMGEIPVNGEKERDVFSRYWKDAGFSVDSKNASLVSVVMHDPYEDIVFTGHTGVAIDCGGYLLFVEKIAFEQPYQVTKIKDMDELIDLFRARPDYFGGGEEAGPFVYVNGVLQADLSGKISDDSANTSY